MNNLLGRQGLSRDAEQLQVLNHTKAAPAGTAEHGGLLGLGDDDHGQYVHLSSDRIITAQHTFAPGSAQAPFVLGANAVGQTVTGLRADQLNKTLTAGSGLIGGGLFSIDRTIAINWGSPTITTIQPDDSPSAGSSENPARADHRHAINAGIAGTIQPGDTAGEGTSTGFARADHRHGILTGTATAITPGASASDGTATGFSRYDHVHGVAAAAPGADSVNVSSSSEGISTSFARADHTHNLDEHIAPVWTNDHVFQGLLTSRHHLPELPDTYDLGSSTKLWRKGWLSELDAILFAQNTITLLGGWFMITKAEGTLIADLPNGEIEASLSIDYLSSGDIIVLRSSLQVEYIRIEGYDGNNVYFVTRDLDGSGSNTWSAGSVFACYGQAGDGRIELNAYDSPRIQILSQGAAYNQQTELIRLGDLNGNWGYTASAFGIALGEYASNKANLTWDPTNGLRIRTYTTTVIQLDNSGNADITGKLRLPGTNSALAIGTTPPTAYNAGTGLWLDRTGLYSLLSNVYQVKIDAVTGKFYAGGGKVFADVNGISFLQSATVFDDTAAVRLVDPSGTLFAKLQGRSQSGSDQVSMVTVGRTDRGSMALITANGGAAYSNIATLHSYSEYSDKEAYITAQSGSTNPSMVYISAAYPSYAVANLVLQSHTDGAKMRVAFGGTTYLDFSSSAFVVTAADLYSVPETNYGTSSTIVGWSSFTYKEIMYKKIGKTVFVTFYLDGTSNSTQINFTLPYALKAAPPTYFQQPIVTYDNGSTQAIGLLLATAGSATVNLYPSATSSSWTNINRKMVRGQFSYETA